MQEAERNERRQRIHRHEVAQDDLMEDGEDDIREHDDVSAEDVWAKGFEDEMMKGMWVGYSTP